MITLANQEIERKFLVKNASWREGAGGTLYRQGYLCSDAIRTVRARTVGGKASLNIKGAAAGISRAEFEYEIPVEDANFLLDNLCGTPVIEKNRFIIEHCGMTWEVDEFLGENEGLIIAEIELPSEDHAFDLPGWAGDEVSGDNRYYNAYLGEHAFSERGGNAGDCGDEK